MQKCKIVVYFIAHSWVRKNVPRALHGVDRTLFGSDRRRDDCRFRCQQSNKICNAVVKKFQLGSAKLLNTRASWPVANGSCVVEILHVHKWKKKFQVTNHPLLNQWTFLDEELLFLTNGKNPDNISAIAMWLEVNEDSSCAKPWWYFSTSASKHSPATQLLQKPNCR